MANIFKFSITLLNGTCFLAEKLYIISPPASLFSDMEYGLNFAGTPESESITTQAITVKTGTSLYLGR
jgi:hypothetical protein